MIETELFYYPAVTNTHTPLLYREKTWLVKHAGNILVAAQELSGFTCLVSAW